jgi:uncharacterized repeat protein (TIGR01451 family)
VDRASQRRSAGTVIRVGVLAITATIITLAVSPAFAADPAPGAAADAYALLVDVKLLPAHTPVLLGPLSRASQDFPPAVADPAEAQVLQAGPAPADGSVLNHVGVMTAIADADGTPQAVAASETADVSLLKSAGKSMITADLVRAQANSDCTNNPNATGTTFVDLKINGTPIENTPAPNTVVDLTVAKVILNEQRPAYDGRGIVVNAIHVISTTTGDPLFRGDVIVSHAMSTVACPNGAGSTGGNSVIKFTKTASDTSVEPGDTFSYTAKVTNSSASACLVNEFIEHLASAFDFVSTTGDFGDTLDRTVARTGGGSDLQLGNGKTIAAGATATQTFVVKVRDDAKAAVYYNNLELFCANLGNFVKGLDAPVEVTGAAVANDDDDDDTKVLGTRTVAKTGDDAAGIAALSVLMIAGGFAMRRRTAR